MRIINVATLIILSLLCCGFTWGKNKDQRCRDANEIIYNQQLKALDTFPDDLVKKVSELCPDGIAQKMLQGIKLEQNKQPDQAIRIYENILKQDEYFPDAFGHLGLLQMARNDKPAAMVSLTKALEHGGKNPRYHLAIAELLLETQAFPIALYHFDQALIVSEFRTADTLSRMATAYSGMKNWNMAESFLRQALILSPNDTKLITALAQVVIRQQRLLEGIELLKKAVASASNDKSLHRQLADALNASGDVEAAKSELILAGIDVPDSTRSLVKEGDKYFLLRDFPTAIRKYKDAVEQHGAPEAFQKLGDAYLAIGNDEDALKIYKKSLLISPDDAAVHYSIGIILERKGEITGAISEYEHCVTLDKNNSDAHRRLADIYLLKGNLNRAISEYKTIISVAPDNPVVHFKLARAYLKAGKLIDTFKSLETSIKLDPTNLEPRRELVRLEIKRKNLSAAEKQCREILVIDREDQEERNRLIGILTQQKKYDELIVFLTEECIRYPSNNISYYRLGIIKDYLKDYPEAIKAFMKSNEISPTAKVYHALARTYLRISDSKKAREALVEANKLDPKRQETKELLELIDMEHGNSNARMHKKNTAIKNKKNKNRVKTKNKK